MNLSALREKHPQFIYEKFAILEKNSDLHICFDFTLSPNIKFSPSIIIKNAAKKIETDKLDNFAFHLGLIEILSYWKATCSPEIIIKAGYLSFDQIAWWHNLLIKGMGEFFYINKIDFTPANFVQFTCQSNKKFSLSSQTHSDSCLIAVGGGKDSIVTLKLLAKTNSTPFILNPNHFTDQIINISKTSRPIIVERSIDPVLLELNQQNYLNGHTPFSAYLAFLSVMCAEIFDHRQVVVSNEQSANEANVTYLGHQINHQFSKSWPFEDSFRQYCSSYLTNQITYFSFLRPLYELQITKIFSRYPQYFSIFRSCNNTKTAKTWCGQCPKCLFIFTALYAFIGEKAVGVFGENLFNNLSLLTPAKQSLGVISPRPFECIGTIEETKIAFHLAINKYPKQLPPLLVSVRQLLEPEKNLNQRTEKLMRSFSHQHFLRSSYEKIIRSQI